MGKAIDEGPMLRSLSAHFWLLIGLLALAGLQFAFTNWWLLAEPGIRRQLGSLAYQLAWLRLGFGIVLLLVALYYTLVLTRSLLAPLKQQTRRLSHQTTGGPEASPSVRSFRLTELDELERAVDRVERVMEEQRRRRQEEATAFRQLMSATVNALEDAGALKREADGMAERLAERALELERAVSELTASEAAKDEFLAQVSHELRTPLTVVRNAASILIKERAGVLTTEQHEFCAIIAAHTERLTRLVDDLLEMQTLAAQPLALALDEADLRALVPEVATSFQSVLEANGLEMVIALPPEPVPVRFDHQRLSQVLLNLLSNAGKFTPAGGTITLRLERRAEEAWLSVSDTGIGLKPEELPLLFDKFVQLEAGKQSQAGGTGLGLAICKQLIEEGHGGRIWAEPLPDGGARFTVALPLSPFAGTRAVSDNNRTIGDAP